MPGRGRPARHGVAPGRVEGMRVGATTSGAAPLSAAELEKLFLALA